MTLSKKYIGVSSIVICLSTLFILFQNSSRLANTPDCKMGTNIPDMGWKQFPKLYFTSTSLGRAVSCAREDLRDELVSAAHEIHRRIKVIERPAVTQVGSDVSLFLQEATGKGFRVGDNLSPVLNFNVAGDARVVQKLSAAAFFVDSITAQKYRETARRILLHWARHTIKDGDEAASLQQAKADGNFGLSVGSSMTAFAFGYDLLAAGKGMTSANDRKLVESWFRRAAKYIQVSNNVWLQSCVDKAPFDYDGKSCDRAMGDNHVTVATAALYALAVMTGNSVLAQRAITNTTPYKWGYLDRLGTIIYNAGESTSPQDRFRMNPQDRFSTVHTGEIYDRWRGHYNERVRGLQLHRSMSYPYLSLSFLTAQALMAQRQGVDLLQPVAKANGQSIHLAKAFLFYRIFLDAYNPGVVIDPNLPTVGSRGERFDGIRSLINYLSLEKTYCVNGFSPEITDDKCIQAKEKGLVADHTNKSYTDGYYHSIFAGAHYLLKGKDPLVQKSIEPTITREKMTLARYAFSGHIMPFEPALLIEK